MSVLEALSAEQWGQLALIAAAWVLVAFAMRHARPR